MSGFVASVELIQASFTNVTGLEQVTVNLSKGQDETQCVPFYTLVATGTTPTELLNNVSCSIEMIDNAGTPACRCGRFAQPTSGTVTIEITVVEFASSVTVQQGSVATAGSAARTDTITAVADVNNAFITFTQEGSTGTYNDRFYDGWFQARFNSTAEIQFDRRSNTTEWNIFWYIVEGNGSDFLTEYVEDSWTSAETGPTALTLSNTVVLANAFTVCSYETSEGGDDLNDGISNVALTGVTTLTWYRDVGTPAATGTLGCWVVRGTASEFTAARYVQDTGGGANEPFDKTITAVDNNFSLVLPTSNVGMNNWATDDTTNGAFIPLAAMTAKRSSTTNVRLERSILSVSGIKNYRFEVVEFVEFSSGGAVGNGLTHGLKLQRLRLAA